MKNQLTRFLAILSLVVSVNSTIAQITGTVFHDYNADGIQNNTLATATSAANIETGILGVNILAYNASDVLIATQTTNANGSYTFPIGSGINQIPNNTPVRIEYSLPQNCLAHSSYDFVGLGGASFGSNVQFKTQLSSAVITNFAISNPSQYRGTVNNPKIFVPRHTNGNPLAIPVGNSANEIALYSFNYTASGQTKTGNNARISLATAAQIGTCWGVAYNKYNDRLYTAAFVKRHTGLGPGGPSGSPSPLNAPGAIYLVNPNSTNSGSFFFSMDALGASYYSHDHNIGNPLYVRDNVARGLGKDIDSPSADAAAFDQVGKVGIGDLEFSDDGRYMWLTNLYNRKIYRVDITDPTNPIAPTPITAATAITSWSLPSLSCSNGILRPWGLKWHNGKIYVGVVCTGENDINANSTINVNTNFDATTVMGGSYNVGNAYILELNPTGAGTWQTALTIPLNYPRGNAADENFNITRWFNWTSNIAVSNTNTSGGALIRPQPILTNIEFDVDGTMMIGFMDRLGNQTGIAQPDVSGTGNFYGEVGGDLLRAFNNGCTFQLESNGKEGAACTKPATNGANHGQGPGSGAFSTGIGGVNGTGYGLNYGEFYHNERFYYNNTYFAHNETSLGGLAFLPGSNEIVAGSMDPFDIFTNGANRYSNTTGDSVSRYEIITITEPGTFAKASGLGDFELVTPKAPIEIGNRIWFDVNNDGIQGADENGIAGTNLELYDPNTSIVIGTVTTNANGNYYFSSASGTNTIGVTYNLNIKPHTAYVVRLSTSGVGNSWDPTANSGAGGPRTGGSLIGLQLTQTAVVGNGTIGLSDNDAIITSGVPQVAITTGEYGEANDNIDFGFKPGAVLPINFLNFTATQIANQVNLQWTVSDQLNVSNYDVLFSADGRIFNTVIATVIANTNLNATYNAIHAKPIDGTNYYRLKTIEKDGTIRYSEIRKVTFGRINTMSVYPNPAKNIISLSFNGTALNKPASIFILSIDGKLISQQKITNINQIELLDVSKLTNGNYLLKVVTGDNTINTKLLINRQ